MRNPVDDPAFWKARIDDAERRGLEHYSVYVVNDSFWNNINEKHKEIIEKVIGTRKALDAGCGYGRVSEWIPNYTGVDFSPDFIEKAKGKYPEAEFVQSSLDKLPFADNTFDIAFCISVRGMIIGNLGKEAWAPMEKEIKRVAKDFLVLEYIEPHIYELNGIEMTL